MSAQPKNEIQENNHYLNKELPNIADKRVNMVDLVARLKDEEKKERKNNIILSAAAISAVTVLGVILTL